jgi:hypothetical protein
MKVDSTYIDSYIGKTISCIKLGKYEEAIETMSVVYKFKEWTSPSITQVQMFFIYAICAKITQRVELGCELYKNLKEGIRLTMNRKISNSTWSLVLLLLEKSRDTYSDRIFNFIELLKLTD